jgi:hypothetical protein
MPITNSFVYRVMKNADSIEGRGPMVYAATLKTFSAANAYVMYKAGRTLKVQRNGNRWSYANGYEIHEDEVMQEFDMEQVEADKKELQELEERVAILRAKTKL